MFISLFFLIYCQLRGGLVSDCGRGYELGSCEFLTYWESVREWSSTLGATDWSSVVTWLWLWSLCLLVALRVRVTPLGSSTLHPHNSHFILGHKYRPVFSYCGIQPEDYHCNVRWNVGVRLSTRLHREKWNYKKNTAIIIFIYKSYPRNRPWRPIGLWDVKGPTLSRQ
jgi:hypothetical protein